MNTKLLLNATLSALTASAMVHAEPAPIIAVANPKCNLVISQPDNSAGYYLNGDCKAAFVLPPKSGAAKVEAISQVGNLDMCPGLSKARVRGEKYQDQVDKLVAQLVTDTGLTTQQQTNIRDNIALISGLITSLYQPYDMVPAATIQISYTQPSIDQWVGEFLRRNPNVGADYGLKFYPAQISDGILVFSALDQLKTKISLSPVVMANFPNMKPDEADPSRFTGTAIVANGDMAGQLVLSLAGVCGSAGNGPQAQLDRKALTANLVANVTYTVPVVSSAGYSAKLDTETFLQNWSKSTKSSGRNRSIVN